MRTSLRDPWTRGGRTTPSRRDDSRRRARTRCGSPEGSARSRAPWWRRATGKEAPQKNDAHAWPFGPLVSTARLHCHDEAHQCLAEHSWRWRDAMLYGARHAALNCAPMANPPLNPYAPPKAADAPAEPLVFGDFDIGRAINEAWEACKRYFPLWLGVLVVGG